MAYYIKDKETGEWMRFGYDEGWYDEENDCLYGDYWYLVSDDFKYAADFDSEEDALRAIWSAEEDLEDYEIVEVL